MDDLDRLIMEIINSKGTDTLSLSNVVWHAIRSDLQKKKYGTRQFDKNGILAQWADDKKEKFLWKKLMKTGSSKLQPCSLESLKNRITKIRKNSH